MKILASALLFATIPLLGACSDHSAPASSSTATAPSGQPQTMLGRKIQEGMDEARQKMLTSNIDISSTHIRFGKNGSGMSVNDDDHSDRPKAEITPQGDLLIEGKQVTVDANQRALLLTYRGEVIQIASSGMAIGAQGADLGISAAKEAIWGAINGKNDKDIEASIKPQTDRIKAEAKKLCTQLPAMRDTQQKLAASVPAFKPYATLDQDDIDDCAKNIDDDDDKDNAGAQTQAEVQDAVRDNIRSGIRSAVQHAAGS